MTSRELTQFRALPEPAASIPRGTVVSDWACRLLFGAIGWPWLARSLWGGTKRSKARLLERIGLADDALPHLGSWKADTAFLHQIVDAIEELRPRTVVELGAGASTLVCAKALSLHGGGRLVSYDQHASFARATMDWLAQHHVSADVRHAPLAARIPGWPGRWYQLDGLPDRIDMLVIDGPPWAVHPFVRGAAECLFPRLAPGGVILLDDARRPGERIVARQWRQSWPTIRFSLMPGGTKGTLIGRKALPRAPAAGAFAGVEPSSRSGLGWRAGVAALLLAAGWLGRDATDRGTPAGGAVGFLDAAAASQRASAVRGPMRSQVENRLLDRIEISRSTGILLPAFPAGWQILDVQLYPAATGVAIDLVLLTERRERVSLFASRAETPAEADPLLAVRGATAIAFWEAGDIAFALSGPVAAARMLTLAQRLAQPSRRT